MVNTRNLPVIVKTDVPGGVTPWITHTDDRLANPHTTPTTPTTTRTVPPETDKTGDAHQRDNGLKVSLFRVIIVGSIDKPTIYFMMEHEKECYVQ